VCGDKDYDKALRAFVTEREQQERSQAQVWQNCFLASLVAFVIFLAGANIGGGLVMNITNDIYSNIFDPSGEPIGFGIFMWFVTGTAFTLAIYSLSRTIYYSKLADMISSEFKPIRNDLFPPDSLTEGRSVNNLTDLRRQFYGSYEHILTKQKLEREYWNRHINEHLKKCGGRGSNPSSFLQRMIMAPIGGYWVSLMPQCLEEFPHKYHLKAPMTWVLVRSVLLGFFWASFLGFLVIWGIDTPPLSLAFIGVTLGLVYVGLYMIHRHSTKKESRRVWRDLWRMDKAPPVSIEAWALEILDTEKPGEEAKEIALHLRRVLHLVNQKKWCEAEKDLEKVKVSIEAKNLLNLAQYLDSILKLVNQKNYIKAFHRARHLRKYLDDFTLENPDFGGG